MEEKMTKLSTRCV